MATPNFLPELWSAKLIEKMKEGLMMAGMPKRDKYSQMLRDKALGRPEFPDVLKGTTTNSPHMTATEMRMRNEHSSHMLDAYVYSRECRLRDRK